MKPIHLYIHVLIIFTDLCKSAGMPHWLRVRRADSTYTTSICENSQAILRCPSPGDTMHIVSANYGRTDDRTCVRGQLVSETSCISDTSFHIIYDRCEGRTTCVIPANNGVFGDPCPGVRKYLEVKYSCGAPQDQTSDAPEIQSTVRQTTHMGPTSMVQTGRQTTDLKERLTYSLRPTTKSAAQETTVVMQQSTQHSTVAGTASVSWGTSTTDSKLVTEQLTDERLPSSKNPSATIQSQTWDAPSTTGLLPRQTTDAVQMETSMKTAAKPTSQQTGYTLTQPITLPTTATIQVQPETQKTSSVAQGTFQQTEFTRKPVTTLSTVMKQPGTMGTQSATAQTDNEPTTVEGQPGISHTTMVSRPGTKELPSVSHSETKQTTVFGQLPSRQVTSSEEPDTHQTMAPKPGTDQTVVKPEPETDARTEAPTPETDHITMAPQPETHPTTTKPQPEIRQTTVLSRSSTNPRTMSPQPGNEKTTIKQGETLQSTAAGQTINMKSTMEKTLLTKETDVVTKPETIQTTNTNQFTVISLTPTTQIVTEQRVTDKIQSAPNLRQTTRVERGQTTVHDTDQPSSYSQTKATAAPTVAVQTTTEPEKPATTHTTISTMESSTEELVVTVEMGTESPVKLTTEQQVATVATTSDELPATEEQRSSSAKPATEDNITMEMPVTRENVPESPTQPITVEQGVTMATTESHLPLTLQMTTESQGAGQTTESTVTGQGTAETPAHEFTTRRDHISLLSTSNGLPYPSWGTSPDVVTQRYTTTPQPTIDTNSPVNLTPSKPYRQTTQLYVSTRHQSSETPQLPVETPETPFGNYPTVPSDAPKTPAETTRTPARTLQPPNGTVELPTETPAPTAETPVSSVKTPAETPATSARTPTSKSLTGAQTLAPTVITPVQPVKTPGTPTAETQTTAAETLAPTTRTPVRPIETSVTPAMTPAPTAEKPATPHGIPVSPAQTPAERPTTPENSPTPPGETQTPGATSTGEPDEDPGQQSTSSDLPSMATAAMATKDYGETSTPENRSTKPYPRITTKKLPPPITDPVVGTTKSEHLSTRETKQPIMTSITEPRTKQTEEPIITPVSSGTPIKSTEQPKPTTATGSQSSATNSEEPIRSSVSEPSPSHTEHPTTKITNATTGRRQTSTATTQRRTAKPTPPSPVMVCDSTVARDLTWPATKTGNLVIQQCPEGTTGQAIWYCDGTPAKWSPSSGPDLSDCKSQAVEQISEMISNISSPSDVQMVTELLVKSTSGNQTLYGGDIVGSIDNMNELLLNMDPFLQNMTPEESYQFADGVVEANLNTGSNLLEHSNAWVDLPTDKQSEEATKLLQCMEQSGFMLVNQLQVGSAVVTVTNKILMELSAQNTSDENLTDAEFPGKDMEDDATQWKYVTDSIKLTNETLKQKSVNDTTRLVFFLYDEISGFLSVGGKGNTAEESNNTTESIVNSKIISASINQMSTPSNLAEPAIIVLEHTETENVTAARCSFWNFTRSGDGEWSDYGCETVESNETHTVCACSHLTNFAIIMDIRGLRIPLVHHFALSVITYAGFIISICCMVLCLVTFCACRNLQNDRNTIHKNLCLCLLIAEVIFMAGIDRTENEKTCAVIAGLLHYFFLAAFAWMSLEGIQIYVMLIEVFEAKKSRKKYYYPYGYVVPAIVVGVSAGIYPQGYGTSQYCWITIERGLIWAFVGPVCAVILVNIIFLLVAGVIMYRHSGHAPSIQQNKDASQLSSQQPCPSMRRRSSSKLILGKTKCQETQAWLKGACVLLCLLGITWVFGLLYINSETLFMAYIFTVLNAFQGLFIFVFHCLMNDKVKKEYKRHIRHSRCCPSCIRDRISSSAYSNQGQGSSGASSKKAARASMGNHSSDKRHSASSISQNMGTAGATTRAVAVIQPMLHNGSVYEYNPETREKGIQADISPGITRQDSREEMLREAVDVKFNLQPLDLKRTSSDPCLLTPLNQNGYATFMFDQLSRDGTSDTFDSVEDSAAHHSMPNLLLTSPQILQKQQQLELVDRKILQNGKPPQLENLGEQDVSLVQYRRIGSDWNVRNGGTISRARTNSGSSNLPVHIRHTKILDSDGRPWSRISISPILVRKQLLSLSGQDADNPNARGLFSLEDRAKSGSEGSIVLKKWRTTDDIVTSSSISDEETTNQPTEISDSNGDVPSVRTKPDGTGSHGSYQGGTPRKSRYTYFETYL
ncbi:uncharacterized protein [Ptychodera flava]|uniref:uncharacterized protein isoform X2 n=1 Tax=Ptychodera flava TaxID=63121 RepID=UPI00396A82C7